jgi:phenylacetyl-CoA:acceptor oxidoreductase
LELLDRYNEIINRGRLGIPLAGEHYDYSLARNVPHSCTEIWDAVAKAASHELTNGDEVRGIEWFKTNGYLLRPARQLEWYLYPEMKRRGLRFELPYQERLKRHGAELASRLAEAGIDWWQRQLDEYEAMPSYVSFPRIWIDHVAELGANPEDYPFWALTTRSMQFAWGANVTLPMMHEAAANVAGHRGVVMNRRKANVMGICEGDELVIESPTGLTRGRAELREGIRPDTVLLVGQFDHWATPLAKDLHLPSLNSVTSLSLSLTDNTGSSSDLARVQIYKLAA